VFPPIPDGASDLKATGEKLGRTRQGFGCSRVNFFNGGLSDPANRMQIVVVGTAGTRTVDDM